MSLWSAGFTLWVDVSVICWGSIACAGPETGGGSVVQGGGGGGL